MLWFKSRSTIDDAFMKIVQKQVLRARVINACRDNTDYELRLKTALVNNRHNINLMTKIAGHMAYLKTQKIGIQQAAKETLEQFID